MVRPSALLLLLTPPAWAADLTVGRGGDFGTIRDAVAAAEPGSTIHVAAGRRFGDEEPHDQSHCEHRCGAQHRVAGVAAAGEERPGDGATHREAYLAERNRETHEGAAPVILYERDAGGYAGDRRSCGLEEAAARDPRCDG